MKKSIRFILVLMILPFVAFAQEDSEKQNDTLAQAKEKLERAAFESSYIIDNQTDVLLRKNALEVMFQHRMGTIDTWEDFYGLWGAANIRIGASYGVHERSDLGQLRISCIKTLMRKWPFSDRHARIKCPLT